MNQIAQKAIFFFIGGLIFVGLIFYSFSYQEENLSSLPDFNIQSNVASGSFLEENIDIFSKVYSSSENYEILEGDKKLRLSMGTGTYLFDFKNPLKKVVIEAETYTLKLDSGGILYVEDTGEKVVIAAFNSIVNIDFFNTSREERTIESYLYPHMYLGFSVKRFKARKNLDSLRISQLGNLGYFPETFDDIISSKKSIFTSENSFLAQALTQVKKSQEIRSNIFKQNLFLAINEVPGVSYLEKYSYLFYNEGKKLTYLKNRVLENLIFLLSNNKGELDITREILGDMSKIKNLDGESFLEMLRLIDNFYLLSLENLDAGAEEVDNNFFTLINKLFGNKSDASIFWNKDFNRLNIFGTSNVYTSLLNNHDSIEIGKDGEIKYEYYLFFLKNIILSGLENNELNSDYFGILIQLLNKYSQVLESQIKDSGGAVAIVNNEEILAALESAILLRYFDGRTKDGLLILKDDSFDKLDVLNETVTNIMDFYDLGKPLFLSNNGLSTKYNNLIGNYDILKQKFTEYFSAMKNYSLYKKNYGVNIIDIKVYNDSDEGLSLNKFLEFIKDFNGIDLSSIDVGVEEDLYRVNNIKISNNNTTREFSFLLQPSQDNRVTEIKIKDFTVDTITKEGIFYYNLENITYDLDIEEEKYKELFSKAKDEDKEISNFKNFFINKFFSYEKQSEEQYNDKVEGDIEDEVIQLFKSATLLGKKGEFKVLEGVLDIKYNNIKAVKKEGNNSLFDIWITNALLKIRVAEGQRLIQMGADFDSDYILDGEKHYFTNIKFRPYKKSGVNQVYAFGDYYISLIGDINIGNFKDEMEEIFGDIGGIQDKYKKYISENGTKITNINYNLITREVTFN